MKMNLKVLALTVALAPGIAMALPTKSVSNGSRTHANQVHDHTLRVHDHSESVSRH